MEFFERIRLLRKEKKMTQKEVAAALHIGDRAYQCYELNQRFPDFHGLIAIADFFDVSLDYLAGRTNLPKNPHGITIADDALLVLQKYTALTERNKGRLEQFLDTLSEQQAQQKETRSSV